MSYESGELDTDFTQRLRIGELSEMSDAQRLHRIRLAHAYRQRYRDIIRETLEMKSTVNEHVLLKELDFDEKDSVDLMKAGLSARFIGDLEQMSTKYGNEGRVGEDVMFGVHWLNAVGQYLIPTVHIHYSGADRSLAFSFIPIFPGEYPDLTNNQIATLEECADRKTYANTNINISKS